MNNTDIQLKRIADELAFQLTHLNSNLEDIRYILREIKDQLQSERL